MIESYFCCLETMNLIVVVGILEIMINELVLPHSCIGFRYVYLSVDDEKCTN